MKQKYEYIPVTKINETARSTSDKMLLFHAYTEDIKQNPLTSNLDFDADRIEKPRIHEKAFKIEIEVVKETAKLASLFFKRNIALL